jgi:ABC-type nickel/cobalt efflux system permease component RcnA
MWGIIAALLIVIAIWILWRVLRPAAAAEPPEIVNVREPVPKRPLNRSGAVALEEPDEN